MSAGSSSGAAGDWNRPAAPGEAYERGLVPILFEPWARDLIERLDPCPGERVLDLACGTGVVARLAASRVGPTGVVTGVDINPDMLAVARRVSGTGGAAVTWRRADACDTGLPEAGFDVAFCEQGLQFVADRPAALRELHRVVAPGGRIAVSTWCDPGSPGYAPMWPAFRRHMPEIPEAVSFLDAIFSLSDGDEFRRLLTRAGFQGVRVERVTDTVRCGSAVEWVNRFLDAMPVPRVRLLPAPVSARIAGDVAEALRDHAGENGVCFRVASLVATAVR